MNNPLCLSYCYFNFCYYQFFRKKHIPYFHETSNRNSSRGTKFIFPQKRSQVHIL
ncbi:hypothetical protein MtrunA17_Chr4g0032651 [Medicago truncatula]|uniref:Uncharacterized protein n=1 Tax=Medicago truncatula TaxID=3880 RepID=A0A396I647_MEDTR|nr:hypothetical protein MtrunA17_Chr4g0032651 [Medicago truncatula]